MNKSEKNYGHTSHTPSENHMMPDEIWAQWTPADVGCGEWDKVSLGDDVSYIRTDIHEKVKEERDELRALLNQAVGVIGHCYSNNALSDKTGRNIEAFYNEVRQLIIKHEKSIAKTKGDNNER